VNEVLIAGQPYPLAFDSKEGLLWRVTDVGGQPIEETWQDWSGGGFETEHRQGTYLYSDGFDATSKGTLRFSPTIKSLVSSGLSTDFGYFFEAMGASGSAPVFDAAVSGDTAGTAATSLTLSNLTVASGNQDRIVIVFVTVGANLTAPFCSTVTFAGQQCTHVGGPSQVGCSTEIWYLLSPPEGAGSTVITLRTTGTQHIAAAAASFYNVHQTAPFAGYNVAIGTSGTVSLYMGGVSTQTIIAAVGIAASLTVTPGASETERWDNNDGANITQAGVTEAGSATALIDPTFTSNNWAAVGVLLAPVTTQYYYCAEGTRIWKLQYDSDAGITEVVIESGTVDSATATTLTDTGAFTGNTYGAAAGRNIVKITGGTGSGQYRTITSHTNDTLTVADWNPTPDGTSTYSILASIDVASSAMRRPFFYYSKWYVPCGASTNVRRLDTVGATQDTWADSGFVSLHNSGFQKTDTPNFAGAKTANQIGVASSAPTSALTSLGSGVGDTSTTITDLVETQGYLFPIKEDGFFEFDADGIARPVDLGLSRSNVDNLNGRGTETFGDMIVTPYISGMLRYQIGSGVIPVGIEEIKGVRRVPNTGITLPKDRRPVGCIRVGKYFYTAYNSATKSLLCQFRLREQGDPPGPEWIWHSLKDISLVKGLGHDSRNRLWMKGADADSGSRAFQVMELDQHGGTDTQYRRGDVSETYTIIFGEWTPNDGEQVQDRAFELELSGGWSAQTSLQPQVYRNDGNSVESVGSAITASGVTINNWTTGTNDTEYRSFTVIEVTTGATYTPLASDPMIMRVRRKGRTPMLYRCVIPANDAELGQYGLTAEDARQNLYRYQNAGVIAFNEPGPSCPSSATFNAEVVAVKDVRFEAATGIGYGIELTLLRHVHD